MCANTLNENFQSVHKLCELNFRLNFNNSMQRTTSYENYRVLKVRDRQQRKAYEAAVAEKRHKRKDRFGQMMKDGVEDHIIADKETMRYTRATLSTCRVLHISAGKVVDKTKKPALHLVAVDDKKERRSTMNAREFVQQMYLRNCALCVLSRFGLMDDIYDPNSADPSCDFIESLHMAGAKTIVYPLWGGAMQGSLGVLAHTLGIIRFYEDLSYLADEAEPIADACRRAQLWLRENTVDEMMEYVKSRPRIKEKTKLALVADLDRFAAANTPQGAYRGATKLFSHFIYWASFCVSGIGKSVHPPELGDVRQADGTDARIVIDGGKVRFNAREAEMEVQVLMMEGKRRQAEALMNLVRKQRIDIMRSRYRSVAGVMGRNMKRLKEGLTVLLDSDSDNDENKENGDFEEEEEEEEEEGDEESEDDGQSYFKDSKLRKMIRGSGTAENGKNNVKMPSSPSDARYDKTPRLKKNNSRTLRPVTDWDDEDDDISRGEKMSVVCTVC